MRKYCPSEYSGICGMQRCFSHISQCKWGESAPVAAAQGGGGGGEKVSDISATPASRHVIIPISDSEELQELLNDGAPSDSSDA
jgi:hypothetical protein